MTSIELAKEAVKAMEKLALDYYDKGIKELCF